MSEYLPKAPKIFFLRISGNNLKKYRRMTFREKPWWILRPGIKSEIIYGLILEVIHERFPWTGTLGQI